MRLLDASTLTFVNKDENEVPSYAILSHTWGHDDEEVSFSDMQSFSIAHLVESCENHTVLRKPGFAKIRNCASLAKSQGLDFIWVDTCCIDQSSSAEISEAINSMFRWYRNASVCFALLSDVGAQKDDALAQAVRSSRWFTRGWTLQELIAPSKVHFYSRDWTLLGTRDAQTEFQRIVSETTGIPADLLDGSRSLESFSIAARMKWASCRETKRQEDIAYCLMGIFDIHMPILYGEGLKSFIRLQEEILRVNNDHSLFAWAATSASATLTGLLAPGPACFRNSGNFSPLPLNRLNSTPPSAITNIGLQTYMRLIPTSIPGEFDAILDCNPHGGYMLPETQAAIRLTALGGFQYARGMSHRILDLPKRFVNNVARDGHCLVYVKHKPIQLLPKVEVLGFDNLRWEEHDVYSFLPCQWPNLLGSSNQLGLVRDQGIVAAYRFMFRAAISDFEKYVDVLIGLTIDRDGSSSWSPWCDLIESDGAIPLATIVSKAQIEDPNTLDKRDSIQYSVKSRLCVSFIPSRRYEDNTPFISLEVSKTQELSAQEAEPTPASPPELVHEWTPSVALARELESEASSEFSTRPEGALSSGTRDPLMPKYNSLVEPLAIKDSAATSLVNIPGSKIRINRADDTFSSQLELEHIRRHVSQHILSFDILRPDKTIPDKFEAYFSDLLIKACITNNPDSVEDLMNSSLSTAVIHSWTSEVHLDFQNFDGHKIVPGFRPLHWAALFGHPEVANVLIKHGEDPLLETATGLTAIHIAVVMEHVDVLDKLLASICTPKHYRLLTLRGDCDTVVHFAASYVRSEAVAPIMESLAAMLVSEVNGDCRFSKPNKMGENILHRASAMDNIHAVKWIIQWDKKLIQDQDKRGMTPLFHAAIVGSRVIVRELLNAGAKVSSTDELHRTPLDVACQHGHHQLVDLLVPTHDTFGEQPAVLNLWHFAALSRNPKVLSALKPYMNLFDDTRMGVGYTHIDGGLSALHIASACGSVECVKALCDLGFNTKAKTQYSIAYKLVGGSMRLKVLKSREAKTAEEWACFHKHGEIVEFLRSVDITHVGVT